jgi:hypothetical protein
LANAFASISGLPSALTVSKPSSISRTEWKPVPVATSRTFFTPRALSWSMKKAPSVSYRRFQSMSSSHFSTKLVTYSAT